MPLTAITHDVVIDTSNCTDDEWSVIYKIRPRVSLSCRGCGNAMHAKVSAGGLKFFAHDRATKTCPNAGETAEHRQLKTDLAALIRSYGWTAEVEGVPMQRDAGGWRADVLAIDPNSSRRIAFEVQLAPMTIEVGRERTERYKADSIETVWIANTHSRWLYSLAGVCVNAGEATLDPYSVNRGLARFVSGRWELARDVRLKDVVGGLITCRLTSCEIGSIFETVRFGANDRDVWHESAIVIASAKDVQAFSRLTEVRRAEEIREREKALRHARNIEALEKRQALLLPTAISDALKQLEEGDEVWLGVPPLRVAKTGELTPQCAAGNEKTAYGSVLWIGPNRGNLRLFAVLSPVANRITAGLAISWRRRNVRVYVSEEVEKQRIAKVLEWPTDRLFGVHTNG